MRKVTRGWTRSNSIIFAISLFLHRWLKGRREMRAWGVVPPEPYLVIRLSRTALAMPHFLYGELDDDTGQIKVVSYKPRVGEKVDAKVLFRGMVQRGDPRPAHLPRGISKWLGKMRVGARQGGLGFFSVQTSTRGNVPIWFDEIATCSTNEDLLALIRRQSSAVGTNPRSAAAGSTPAANSLKNNSRDA
jgi:hypothetical protein